MSNLEIKNLKKSYGKTVVLDNIDVFFEENKIYGLLGRNGVGKTTLLNLINNRVFRDSGEILLDGEDIYENDRMLQRMYLSKEQNLYPENIKVKDIFKWTNEFYENFNMEYALELSEKFDLNIKKKFKSLSTGYKSICKIIVALATEAEVIMLDEPILGLDANYRELFYKELMNNYINNPKTIIISTHIIEEIEDIIENVVIIHDKKIIVNKEISELIDSVYTVSGIGRKIEEFIKNKNCIEVSEFASIKTAMIIGELNEELRREIREYNFELGKVKLQKLFVAITENGGKF